ncbi:hypothetical protein HanRHA438_Chr14g0646831 [Helianthus annuus]|uniref:Uncharacterized protein n=1 Tax=Helianthus annuus TaxID=4232 RepID=A0A9K3E7L9_HELAN|nr:hypothetical protein HanXRQr2_Chr14g0636251 [Helianthus annuus]KAJ0839724.1 hypothetical protein HanPSC8_Chr14g0610251 [Helianthus annuus]KAJ0853059.1 hypothetical protein HanRHA438_Chr14g0646831 [Helianthus annuus]
MDLFDPFHPNGSNIYFLSLNLNPNIHFIHIRPHPSLSGDNTLTSLKQNHTDRSNLGFLSICASPLSLAIRSNLGFVLTIISEADLSIRRQICGCGWKTMTQGLVGGQIGTVFYPIF